MDAPKDNMVMGEACGGVSEAPETHVYVNRSDIHDSLCELLRPGVWVSDVILNSYAVAVARDTPGAYTGFGKKHACCVWLPTYLYAAVELHHGTDGPPLNLSTILSLSKGVDPSNWGQLVVPVHASNTHWSLCVLVGSAKRLPMADSARGGEVTEVQRTYVVLRWLELVAIAGGVSFDAGKFSILPSPSTMQQQVADVCVIIVCSWGTWALRGGDLEAAPFVVPSIARLCSTPFCTVLRWRRSSPP